MKKQRAKKGAALAALLMIVGLTGPVFAKENCRPAMYGRDYDDDDDFDDDDFDDDDFDDDFLWYDEAFARFQTWVKTENTTPVPPDSVQPGKYYVLMRWWWDPSDRQLIRIEKTYEKKEFISVFERVNIIHYQYIIPKSYDIHDVACNDVKIFELPD
ncbi:MAG: hypothetical protein HUJ54_06705 [Erysipelotrichaceae bacterium]|nr:hypothetical protein [Erysipelotrichaceae bacterium]